MSKTWSKVPQDNQYFRPIWLFWTLEYIYGIDVQTNEKIGHLPLLQYLKCPIHQISMVFSN